MHHAQKKENNPFWVKIILILGLNNFFEID